MLVAIASLVIGALTTYLALRHAVRREREEVLADLRPARHGLPGLPPGFVAAPVYGGVRRAGLLRRVAATLSRPLRWLWSALFRKASEPPPPPMSEAFHHYHRGGPGEAF